MKHADDNFVSIVHGFEQERTAYDRLEMPTVLLLPINGYAVLSIVINERAYLILAPDKDAARVAADPIVRFEFKRPPLNESH